MSEKWKCCRLEIVNFSHRCLLHSGGKIMKTVTIDEFRGMSDEEKRENYQYMSSHDKYLWRTTCVVLTEVIGHEEVFQEKRDAARKFMLESLRRQGILKDDE